MRPLLYTGIFGIAALSCTGVVEAPDEGSGHSTGVAVCSRNAFWKDADKGSELMRPGGKCNECHNADKTMKAPNYSIAGTVYPTSHEPDDCNGVNGSPDVKDIQIVITDGQGRTLPAIPVNSAGNFYQALPVIPPFKVKVVSKDKENKMVASPPHGDCNKCHTQMGAEGAPGRIVVPQ